MKTMEFVVQIDDLNFSLEDKNKTSQELVFEVIKVFIMSYASENRGLDEEERRKYYKLSDVMEKAIKDEETYIELEDDYAKFLNSCRNQCKLMPNKLTQRVEALIDGLKDKKVEKKGIKDK